MGNEKETDAPVDLFIIGGGINGCGIARDAAGRGYSVVLSEMNDLASATSSASTKLFHGGLRYLEFFEFRLVREALIERETLLRAMPHISWPMRFVLPYHADMRFESDTPTSRLLSKLLPWMKGRRPAWLIRLGLFLYDNLGGRKFLPGTKTLELKGTPEGAPLQPRFEKAFEYSDCWIEDSRLVALNARDAATRGAEIRTRSKVISARREGDLWHIVSERQGRTCHDKARMLVNAAGPWVEDIIRDKVRLNSPEGVRLVRGSHLVTQKLFDHDKCYFFQGTDGRIIFAIPYETDFTLLGTTDAEHARPDDPPECSPQEEAYLLDFASTYFKRKVTSSDVVWRYSGVRPLYDDGAKSATAATRDYVLKLDQNGPPLLNIFGGKITTYRKLAEAALEEIDTGLSRSTKAWTAGAPLPGGDFPVNGAARLAAELSERFPFLSERWSQRLIKAYGTEANEMLGSAQAAADLGRMFGSDLSQREVDWLIDKEWARTGEDLLWRRSKLGLRLSQQESEALSAYVQSRCKDLA